MQHNILYKTQLKLTRIHIFLNNKEIFTHKIVRPIKSASPQGWGNNRPLQSTVYQVDCRLFLCPYHLCSEDFQSYNPQWVIC